MGSLSRNLTLDYEIDCTLIHSNFFIPFFSGYEYESQNWDSDEIPATERDLADDAPWKQIQKNTFTRWCNEHLKVANMRINALECDLSDGLRLIALIEVIIT